MQPDLSRRKPAKAQNKFTMASCKLKRVAANQQKPELPCSDATLFKKEQVRVSGGVLKNFVGLPEGADRAKAGRG